MSPAGREVIANTIDPAKHRAGGKIRPRHLFEQIVQGTVRILRLEHQRFTELRQVMGRDIRRHAHRDSRRTIGKQVGKARRENHRLFHLAIEVLGEVHRFTVDVPEHFHGKGIQSRLGIAIGRC